uniref:TAP42-like family protein n=1 Tax=Bracon brevicornis TaxID=1563983 RepID=A0A6V7IQZ5_9HYME
MESDKDEHSGSDTSLSNLFDSALELFNSLDKNQEPTNSLDVQIQVKKCMKMLEDATKLVSMADMFSNNEEFDEIPTENVKYFLLPALLGSLAIKICDRSHRMHYVNVSEVYFYDFLERVKSYKITDVEIPHKKCSTKKDDESAENQVETLRAGGTNMEMIKQMVNTREAKLKRFKEEKELKEQLEILQKAMKNTNIDDETVRKYFVTLIQSYVMKAIDEINSLAQEREILTYMEKMKKEGGSEDSKKSKDYHPPKLQPIIITKNDIQKQVFGAGYPSLPVMTVEEFYEKKIADGEWTANSGPAQSGKSLQDMADAQDSSADTPEDLDKEKKIENDDEEYLMQQRAMDEYKDNHKRGWGNRHNRS